MKRSDLLLRQAYIDFSLTLSYAETGIIRNDHQRFALERGNTWFRGVALTLGFINALDRLRRAYFTVALYQN
jgi:hypothetical protein